MQFKMTDISQPKKKRKTGGSFFAVGGCSNNSYRDLESAIDGRGFLKFYRLPKDTQRRDKWVARMRRQFGWKPSKHTKICSDHFHESDFITSADLFNGLLSEGLEYSRFIHASAIRDTKKRQEYLSKEVTNGLKRHMLYRNFVLVMSRGYPLAKKNRVVLPRCVVEKIREKYPESEDDCCTGFIEAISE